jgi:hypothetical protein
LAPLARRGAGATAELTLITTLSQNDTGDAMNDLIRGSWANAACNGDFILVETISGYRGPAVRDPKGKQHFLVSDASDQELGFAVIDALAHSRLVAPAPRTGVWIHPDTEFDMELYDHRRGAERYDEWVKDLMTRYGYKTKRALFKNMNLCDVERKADVISITPNHHQKLEAWGREKDDGIENVVIPADSSPAEIGAALRLAFSRCTG